DCLTASLIRTLGHSSKSQVGTRLGRHPTRPKFQSVSSNIVLTCVQGINTEQDEAAGTTTFVVMTRASLGHTGRALIAADTPVDDIMHRHPTTIRSSSISG